MKHEHGECLSDLLGGVPPRGAREVSSCSGGQQKPDWAGVGGGQCCFFARRGTHIILPTIAVAAGSRSPGAHLNKSSGWDPQGSRLSAPSGAE